VFLHDKSAFQFNLNYRIGRRSVILGACGCDPAHKGQGIEGHSAQGAVGRAITVPFYSASTRYISTVYKWTICPVSGFVSGVTR
jgi:hypothetical protein